MNSPVAIPKELDQVLSQDPEVMHGAVCFSGTRVPLTVFLDNLKAGMGMDEFLEEYPSVERPQVETYLEWEVHRAKHAMGLDQAS